MNTQRQKQTIAAQQMRKSYDNDFSLMIEDIICHLWENPKAEYYKHMLFFVNLSKSFAHLTEKDICPGCVYEDKKVDPEENNNSINPNPLLLVVHICPNLSGKKVYFHEKALE